MKDNHRKTVIKLQSMAVSCSFLSGVPVATPFVGVQCDWLRLSRNTVGTPTRGVATGTLVGQQNFEITLAKGIENRGVCGIVGDEHINLIDITKLG
jgi:hypothetical protein